MLGLTSMEEFFIFRNGWSAIQFSRRIGVLLLPNVIRY
jgi:hypothetical protein